MTTSGKREWISQPHIEHVAVEQSGVTGFLSFTFNGDGRVKVMTTHGDTLVFRGKEYRVDVELFRCASGVFRYKDEVPWTSIRANNAVGPYVQAPPTYRARMLDVVVSEAARLWTREIDQRGRVALATQHLLMLEGELKKAQAKVKQVTDEMAPLLRIVGE